MYHDAQVYQRIFNQFSAAWREMERGGAKLNGFSGPVWAARRTEIADTVASNATIPTRITQKDMIQMAMQPHRGVPHHTKDDGIMQMQLFEIKQICRDWILKNVVSDEKNEDSSK